MKAAAEAELAQSHQRNHELERESTGNVGVPLAPALRAGDSMEPLTTVRDRGTPATFAAATRLEQAADQRRKDDLRRENQEQRREEHRGDQRTPRGST